MRSVFLKSTRNCVMVICCWLINFLHLHFSSSVNVCTRVIYKPYRIDSFIRVLSIGTGTLPYRLVHSALSAVHSAVQPPSWGSVGTWTAAASTLTTIAEMLKDICFFFYFFFISILQFTKRAALAWRVSGSIVWYLHDNLSVLLSTQHRLNE